MKGVLVILFLLSGLAQARELVDGTLVTVNNEAILESDLRSFHERLKKNGMVDDLLLDDKSLADLKKNRSDQLEYLVNEKILDTEVKRLNLNITLERVEQEIRTIAKSNGMSRSEMMATLRKQGVDPAEYQDFIKTRIERQSLLEQEITSKIRVSQEEVMAEYMKRNPKVDTSAAEFTVAHIFFNPRKGGPKAAEARARTVLDKLNQGGVFESLAEQHSEDPNFSTGGILGTFKTGEVAKEIENAVSNLNPGQVSGLVKAKSGIHILKLVSRRMTVDPRFERERDRIRAELLERAFKKQFQSWLEQKKEEAFVRKQNS